MAVPKPVKKILLVLISFFFYAWGNPVNLLFLAGSILFNYLTGLELDHLMQSGPGGQKRIRFVLTLAAGADILLLCLFKYSAAALPVGISFYTFSVLSYLFDISGGRAPAAKNLLNFALYVSFFPKLTSGPIVQYRDMEDQLKEIRIRRTMLFPGAQQFLIGLAKKVLIADNLGAAFSMVTGQAQMSVLSAWLGMIFYSFQLYYDFSGYSDMAIGLARVFGFSFAPNFRYPYLSKNVSEFWRRWHISLGAWFREYVYIPLGGNRVSGKRLINLIVVWLLTGVWHGSTLNFIAWGLWHGLYVILERFLIKDHLDRVPGFFRILVTDLIVFIGWVFFFSPSLPAAASYIANLFGSGAAGLADHAGLYCLSQFAILLAAAVIGSTSLVSRAGRALFYENRLHLGEGLLNLLTVLGTCIVLACVTAGMVSSTYQTFLYFRF